MKDIARKEKEQEKLNEEKKEIKEKLKNGEKPEYKKKCTITFFFDIGVLILFIFCS